MSYLYVLFLLGIHAGLGAILASLLALVGIEVVRVRLDGSLALIHLVLGGDRQVGRVGEPHGNERATGGAGWR